MKKSLSSVVWKCAPAPDADASDDSNFDNDGIERCSAMVVAANAGLVASNMKDKSVHPEQPALPEAEFETSTEFEQYRVAYRNFRLGFGKGAKGEVTEVGAPEAITEDSSMVPGFLPAIFAGKDLRDAAYAALREYRLAYRRHRLGAAHGAKGEVADIGKHLTLQACRSLPCSQIAGFRKHLKEWEESVAARDLQDTEALKERALHLHVGAGRLGLGLVLPAIVSSGRPFALIQRNSASWAHALKAGSCVVRLNSEEITKLKVVCTKQETEAALEAGERSLLVLSEDHDVLLPLAARASSYSCAVGGKELSGALAPLLKAARQLRVEAGNSGLATPFYCCENDHDAVESLRSSVTGVVDLVPVLVDRVCTGRDLLPDGSVDVSAEPYAGDLVVAPPDPGQVLRALPFAGDSVRLPRTVEGAEFLHRRKILTVNGTHTTLAFLTLVAAEPSTVGPPQSSHELVSFDVDSQCGPEHIGSAGRICWVWAIARQLMLIDEFPLDVMRSALLSLSSSGLSSDEEVHAAVVDKLLTGARDAVKRLSGGGDQTSRVLGGGVIVRWQGRLANVADWLQAHRRLDPLSRLLLRTAKISDVELHTAVERLVRVSRRFTEPEQPKRAAHSRSKSREARSKSRGRANGPVTPVRSGVQAREMIIPTPEARRVAEAAMAKVPLPELPKPGVA